MAPMNKASDATRMAGAHMFQAVQHPELDALGLVAIRNFLKKRARHLRLVAQSNEADGVNVTPITVVASIDPELLENLIDMDKNYADSVHDCIDESVMEYLESTQERDASVTAEFVKVDLLATVTFAMLEKNPALRVMKAVADYCCLYRNLKLDFIAEARSPRRVCAFTRRTCKRYGLCVSRKTVPTWCSMSRQSTGCEARYQTIRSVLPLFCRPDQCSCNSYVDNNSCLLVSGLPSLFYTMSSHRDIYIIKVKELLHSAITVTTLRRNIRPPMRQCLEGPSSANRLSNQFFCHSGQTSKTGLFALIRRSTEIGSQTPKSFNRSYKVATSCANHCAGWIFHIRLSRKKLQENVQHMILTAFSSLATHSTSQ
jgi:hypothetical protein